MTSKEALPVQYKFSSKTVDCFFDADFSRVDSITGRHNAIVITDENVFRAHPEKFAGRRAIVTGPGEHFKNQQTVDDVIGQLIGLQADRQTYIIGVGGGVVTDITGYVASVYMRGVRFGFVPTSILGMVDACIGGKNGVDVGLYKNIVGVINHPAFLLYDYSFLETLPDEEWVNGFAEIIKHACIKDADLFHQIEQSSLMKFQASPGDTAAIIQRNVDIKYTVVASDELETGERRILNFGHTIGHAIENAAGLAHGHAVSIGMALACRVSEEVNGFDAAATKKITDLLTRYELPVNFTFDKEATWEILQHDKKKAGSTMNFIVLDRIGKASALPISLDRLYNIFKAI
jgi:3-dehydroquinate synthase